MLNTSTKTILFAVFILALITACGGGTVGSNGGSSTFSVVSATPASGSEEIKVSQKIQVVFSDDVDQTSLNAYTFQVMETEGMSIIEGKIVYDSLTRTVTFEPFIPFTYDTPFHVMVTNLIRSTSSVHLANTTSVSFDTEESPDTSSFHPAENVTGVSPRTSIRIQFGTGIDFESFDESAFTLKVTNTQAPVEMEVELDEDAQVAVLWPEEELDINTNYTYTISSAVRNEFGAAYFGFDKSVSFTTASETPFTSFIASSWDDYADSVKLTADGNTLIVAGETWGVLTENVERYDGEAFIAAIDKATGEVLDTIQFGSGMNVDEEEVLEIADPIYDMVTIGNDIYVTGFTEGSFNINDTFKQTRRLFIAKYTWDGVSIFASGSPRFIPASANLEGYAITRNTAGTAVYVIGTTDGGAIQGAINQGADDIVVAKFSTNLLQQWVKQYGTAARDIAKGVAVDGNSVYIVGDTLGDFNNPTLQHVGLNPFMLQLNDTNGERTATPFDTTSAAANQGNAFARTVTGVVAHNGQITMVGTQTNNIGISAFALRYQSTNGVPTYQAWGAGTGNQDEVATGVYADPNGTVYVASTRFHEMNNNGVIMNHGMTEILRLDTSGFSLYRNLDADMHASVRSMVMDNAGTMYATGYVHGHMNGVMPVGMGDVFIARP